MLHWSDIMGNPITPLTPTQTEMQEAKAAHEGYLHRVLVGLDQFLNVVGDGKADMTISTRAGLAAQHGSVIGKTLSDFLNLFQKDHGAKAAAGDAERDTQELQAEQGIISEPPCPDSPSTPIS